MTIDEVLDAGAPPVIAILRGISPREVVPIGEALVAAGIRLVEVPLNSPDPLESIHRLSVALGDRAICGAGTVLEPDLADAIRDAGGSMIVMPNTDPEVIARSITLGMEPLPGFATPSEAFAAVAVGARRLKLFPASTYGIGHLRAIRDVLPSEIRIWAVGGTGAANIGEWLGAGAEGIGVGGALYRAGDDPAVVRGRAEAVVAAWRTAGQASPSDPRQLRTTASA